MAPAERAIDSLPMPADYFRLVLRRFGTTPALARQLLEGTGIGPGDAPAAPDDLITLGQQLRQARNLAERVGPGWGLETGAALGGAAHGILGVATVSAATLAEALSVLARFAHVRAPYFRLEGDDGEDRRFRLRIEPQLRLEPEIWRGLVEALLLSIQALVESALGRPMGEGRIHLGYAAPEYADRYGEFFRAPVAFGECACAVSMPSAWLPLPCPFADPAQHRLAVEKLEAAERSLQGPEFIVAQVERILEGSGDAAPGLASVATQLHVSRRTLVRRLEGCGTSFRAIADSHRRRRACQLLADPHLTVAEVADRLGYTEPANFGRAFRRWFGTSPRRYREQS